MLRYVENTSEEEDRSDWGWSHVSPRTWHICPILPPLRLFFKEEMHHDQL